MSVSGGEGGSAIISVLGVLSLECEGDGVFSRDRRYCEDASWREVTDGVACSFTVVVVRARRSAEGTAWTVSVIYSALCRLFCRKRERG